MNKRYPNVVGHSINLIGFSYKEKEHLDLEVDSYIWNEFMFYIHDKYYNGKAVNLYVKCYNEVFFMERVEKSKWGGMRATIKCVPKANIRKPNVILEMNVSKDIREEGHIKLWFLPRKRGK